MMPFRQGDPPKGEKPTLIHWLPSSSLGGIEMAALTLMQTAVRVRHVVAVGDADGPAVDMWRDAGAEVLLIKGWKSPLGITWAHHWKLFVKERRGLPLIAWSPTRLPQMLAPLHEEDRCIIHLGNVGGITNRQRWQSQAMRMIYRPACRPKLIACSHAVAVSLEAEGIFAGLPVAVVSNPVRAAFYELGKKRPKLVVAPKAWGMVARLDGLKDHRNLIEAVRMLPENLEFRLELVGDGNLAEQLNQQVIAAGLQRRVHFLGAMPRPYEAMRNWQAFVFATTRGEGFGIAVAEAMASGLPCVLSDLDALKEVAGDSAYYALPDSPEALREKILEVISDPHAASARAEEGRLRSIDLFSAANFTKRYLSELGLGY